MMKKVTEHFLKDLDKGDKLFRFPPGDDGSGEDYILFSVVKKPASGKIELINIFDQTERTKLFNITQLMEDNCWFYNPLFGDDKTTGA